jgi:hypothetical protein
MLPPLSSIALTAARHMKEVESRLLGVDQRAHAALAGLAVGAAADGG